MAASLFVKFIYLFIYLFSNIKFIYLRYHTWRSLNSTTFTIIFVFIEKLKLLLIFYCTTVANFCTGSIGVGSPWHTWARAQVKFLKVVDCFFNRFNSVASFSNKVNKIRNLPL